MSSPALGHYPRTDGHDLPRENLASLPWIGLARSVTFIERLRCPIILHPVLNGGPSSGGAWTKLNGCKACGCSLLGQSETREPQMGWQGAYLLPQIITLEESVFTTGGRQLPCVPSVAVIKPRRLLLFARIQKTQIQPSTGVEKTEEHAKSSVCDKSPCWVAQHKPKTPNAANSYSHSSPHFKRRALLSLI